MNEFDKLVPVELTSLDFEFPCNYVLIEYDPHLTSKTPGGVFVPETYADEAKNINRMGTVVKVPKTLFFYKGPEDNRKLQSMRWQTSIEIMPGDQVWFNHLESINAYRYTFEGRFFKTVHYQDIVVARRGEEVIVCNGYVLLEEVEEKIEFQGYSKSIPVQGKGKLAYIGSRNNQYNVPVRQAGSTVVYREDLSCDLPVGEVVAIFKENFKHVRHLEDKSQARFDGRKMFLIVQRHMIACIVGD